MRRILVLLAALLVMLFATAGALPASLASPPAPSLEIPVVDRTGTLTSGQIAEITAVIDEGRSANGQQTAVLVIPSLEGNAIEDYSIQVARDWGIGESGKDNGVLILVATADQELRIEVGRGLEGDIPDAVARRIGDNVMVPLMKEGDLFGAVKSGAFAVQTAGADSAEEGSLGDVSQGPSWWVTLLPFLAVPFFFVLIIAGVVLNELLSARRRKSWISEHGSLVGFEDHRREQERRHRSESSTGSSGRSSRSSFGGGGFSGGGSSSSW